MCHDNSTCIPIGKVCDAKNDCPDSTDEGDHCLTHNNTCITANVCQDNAECFPSPSGPICACKSGYTYNANLKKCEVSKHNIKKSGCMRIFFFF